MIALGEKIIENRTWATPYRGPLAIHAGKSREWMDDQDEHDYPGMVFGAVIAIAQLVACQPVSRLSEELRAHVHANGPWCWVLEDVRRIDPIAARGAQGLWDIDLPFDLPFSTEPNGTPARDAVGEPASDTAAEHTRGKASV